MRICSPQIGLYNNSHLGGGVHDYEILRGLAQLGVEIDIPFMMSINCVKEKNWYIYKIPLKRMYKFGALLTNAVFFIWVVYLWLTKGFDILRVSYPEHAGYMAYLIKKLFRVKTIATYHHLEPKGKLKNSLNKKLANSFTHIIAVSEFTKRQIVKSYGVSTERISVIYNGVSPKYFSNSGQNALFDNGQTKDKTILLFIGSLIERKNLFFLIDVLKTLTSDFPDILLFICGSGYPNDDYETRLKDYVKSHKMDKNVIFTGKIPEEQKVDYYCQCDIYVHPSLLEGFGLSVAEAMACGKSVVASNTGSLREIIEDGETGFLADPKDVRDFSDKIKVLLRDKDLRLKIGAKGRERVFKNFTWEKAVKETLKVFKHTYESNFYLS